MYFFITCTRIMMSHRGNIECYIVSTIILALSCLLSSCHKDDSPSPSETHLTIKFKDAANHYEALYLNIAKVWTRTSSGAGKLQAKGPLNILSIENDTTIAHGSVPTGSIQEIIIELEHEGNEIFINGSGYPLKTPEGNYILVDVPVNNILLPNESHTLLLDIDIQKFIEKKTENEYQIRPVINAILER